MSLAFFGSCASLILGGATIAVPTFLYAKGPDFFLASKTETKQVSETNRSTSRTLDAQTKIFNDCLDAHLKFRVTSSSGDQTMIVTVNEVGKYPQRSGWKVESLYNSQCQEHNH